VFDLGGGEALAEHCGGALVKLWSQRVPKAFLTRAAFSSNQHGCVGRRNPRR